MPQLLLLKIVRNTDLWRKGQKVWLIYPTGDCAYYVIGKYKGKGRWIKGWVHFAWEKNPNAEAKHLGFVEVKETFKQMLLSRFGNSCNWKYLTEPLSG